ncbi:hypothetical protein JOD45_001659 [Scopulibacillus daqui]|uniref:YkoS n=1 Tax=Scopulibacillus daqui TaxID=1469162 RepID=A0ABS2PZH2_9BACL|nr:hypothetical protein [Scopulibacillus daqui]
MLSLLNLLKKHYLIVIGIMLLLLYLSPYVILGEDAHIRVHDNLDSNVAWYKVLADSGKLFGGVHEKIPNIMNGLSRNSLEPDFNILVLLYFIFKPFTAYVMNEFLMRFLAFFGMYLLLKRHFIKEDKYLIIVAGTALAFAVLPFWPSGGGSIAGLPLALYAFLNIRNRQGSKIDWLIVILLPFYASFVLSFAFFLACMGVFGLIDWIKTRRFHYSFFSAIVIMTIVFLFVNYRIIYEMFFSPEFISHREAFNRGNWSAVISLAIAIGVFIFGQTHVIRLTHYIVLPAIIAAFIIAHRKKVNVRLLKYLFLLNLLFSFIFGLYCWGGLKKIKEKWSIFETFNFGRFHFLEPPVWYICFALALIVIWQSTKKFGKPIALSLLCAQIILLFLFNDELKYRYFHYPSYAEFYSKPLFQDIKKYIGKDPADYRVVSIGIHPSIAQYNGFYTLDGYVVSYPLAYKKNFREIIAPELAKNQSIRRYFDNWGSRAYIFTAELGKHYMYDGGRKKIHHLDLNTDALKRMGGSYILSAVRILNAKEERLTLLRSFQNKASPWKIYLYKVE